MLTHLLKILGISAFIALALGCATAEQQQNQMATQCARYGFQRGSPDFARCMMRLDQNNRAAEAAAGQQLLQQSQQLLNPNAGQTYCYPQPNGVGAYCVRQ